jgi:hypothetical protein
MSFDTKAFMKARLIPRETAIPVPDLKDFFPEGEAVWKVRGLTGQELGRVNAAAEKAKNIAAVLDGLLSASDKDKAAGIRKLVGADPTQTPADISRRLEMLQIGSVDPKCDEDLAVRVCEKFPVEFYQLTNEITKLTGQGHELGKPQASGKKGK